MTNLTSQQQAILTEGICPLCQSEVAFCAVEDDKPSLGNTWGCKGCKNHFELKDESDRPHAVLEHNCQQCNHFMVSIFPVNTHFLECAKCGYFNEIE